MSVGWHAKLASDNKAMLLRWHGNASGTAAGSQDEFGQVTYLTSR